LQALYNINLYGGLAIFSLFISYDTQNMIESYKAGDDDHISPALNMFLSASPFYHLDLPPVYCIDCLFLTFLFLDVFNIFVRLIQIFRGD